MSILAPQGRKPLSADALFRLVHTQQFPLMTISNAKPPAMLEESRCFTYAEDLPECFDRSKHYQGDLPCR